MKIEKTYYDLWGKNYLYYIESKASIIAYALSSVVDDVTTSIEYDFISPLTLLTIELPAEGQYKLVIYYPDGSGTATAVYDLRCYPDLKADLIRTFKDAICNCPAIGSNPTVCSTTSMNVVQQDVNFLEMVYNSVNLYRDLLMSPSFLRKYSCCFVTTLGENYYKLETLLKSLYESVTIGGYTPDSMYLLRLYTAYYYVMIYVMELDMASCLSGSGGTGSGSSGSGTDGPDESGSDCEDEVAAVVELFNPSELKECFVKLGLNFNEIYNSFRLCYLQNPIGLCKVAEEVTPPPPPPGVASIDNLTYLDYIQYVEIGEDVIPSLFQWEVVGTPENLVLTDNVGQITDVAVTGTSYNSGAETYNLADKGNVRWDLTGDNVNGLYLITSWLYPAYYGTNLTGIPPDATAITTTGTKIISGNLKNEVLFTPNTAITEYGWVAVPTPEATQYGTWEVGGSILNTSSIGTTIGSTEFIITNPKAWVDVSGVWYAIYIYNYPSEVAEEIKLSNP